MMKTTTNLALFVALALAGVSGNLAVASSTPQPDKRENTVSDVNKVNLDPSVKEFKDLKAKLAKEVSANPENVEKALADYEKSKNAVYDKLKAARTKEYEAERLIKTTKAKVSADRAAFTKGRRTDEQSTTITADSDSWEYIAKSGKYTVDSANYGADPITLTEKNNGVVVKQRVTGPKWDDTRSGHHWQEITITATYKRSAKFINLHVNADMITLRDRIDKALGNK